MGKSLTNMLGGTLLGGALNAQDAANAQVDAANNATANTRSMFDTTQANLKPYMLGGNAALSSLLEKLKSGDLGGQFTSADYLANKDPGYDFQLQQGQQALQNSQAAGDGALSGSALKGLIGFNQGMASTGYQNAYNRWLQSQQNTYGQLSGLASLGENAGANIGNTGANFGKTMSDTITGAGNAKASGIMGVNNSVMGGINSLPGLAQFAQYAGAL